MNFLREVATTESHKWRVEARRLLLARLRKYLFRPKQIYDLGAGTNIDAASYSFMKDESVREVYVIDTNLRLVGACRSPKVIGLSSEEGAPPGLSAMMLHPGFTMTPTEHARYTRASETPTWESTFEKLSPSWVVWCSYSAEEFEEDSSWLVKHGYEILDSHEPPASRGWGIPLLADARYCSMIGVARRKES